MKLLGVKIAVAKISRYHVIGFICVTFSLNSTAEELTFVSDNWCPFVCDSREAPGYVVEVTQQIFKAEGYKATILTVPFQRALLATQTQQFNGVLLVGTSDVSQYQLIAGRQTIAWTGIAFFVRQSTSWWFTDTNSLHNIRLGLVRGYKYGEELDKAFSLPKVSPAISWAHGADPIRQNLSKLVKNRVDVIVDNRHVIEYTASKMGLRNKILFAGSDSHADPLYIGFSDRDKKGKYLAELYDKRMSMLRRSGELDKILAKYGINDWQKRKTE